MKPLMAALVCAATLWITGCYRAPVMPPGGLFYASIQAPIDTDADRTKTASRVGMASSHCVLGLFGYGDASIATAAANGGLTTIDYVDYEFFHVLGVYQRFTTKACGE